MAKEIRKSGKNFVIYTDGSILIKDVRLSYPHLDEPYKGKDPNAKPRYSVVGLANKDTHDAVKDAVVMLINEVLEEKNKGGKIPKDKKFFRNGDDQEKDGYENMWTINTGETPKNPPILRDERNRTVERTDAGVKFYGGCYGNILVKPWFQDNDNGKRVNASILAVQFLRDGEPFGEERISDDDVDGMFDDHGGDDDNGFDGKRGKGKASRDDDDL